MKNIAVATEKVFIPNYLAKPHKKKLKKAVTRNKQESQKSRRYKCEHKECKDIDMGWYYCSLCHEVLDNIYITDDKDDKVKQQHMIIWNREYDRNRWKNYGLDYMLGQNNHKLTDQLWFDILCMIPESFTWYEIYKVFQSVNLLEYWTALSSNIGIPMPLSGKVMEMVDTYLNHCNTKYRVTYLYLMYKFVQMYNPGEEQFIPLARSKAWIEKTDKWWLQVCQEDLLLYAPTKIHKITWNKNEQIRKFQCFLQGCNLEKTTELHNNDQVFKNNTEIWLQKYNKYFSQKTNGTTRRRSGKCKTYKCPQ